jgi:hypothetical protein
MPRGKYDRSHLMKTRVPTRGFHTTFHENDWPDVQKAANQAGLSVGRWIRSLIFKELGRPESPREYEEWVHQ